MRNIDCPIISPSRYFFLCVLSWLFASTNAFHPLASQSPHRILARTGSSCLQATSIEKDGISPKRQSPSVAKGGKPPKQHSPSISQEVEKSPKRQSPPLAKEGKSNKRQSSSGEVDGSVPNKSKNAKVQQQQRFQKPDLAAQLDYARNGRVVIRDVLNPTVIQSLRGDLWKHGKKKELEAWRQKVEVAADSPKLAASCQSVKDCRMEQSKLGVPDDSLPFLQ
jgi:hypothetical protein